MCTPIPISNRVSLRRLQESDADALFDLIDRNRAYLKEWHSWLDTVQETQNTLEFIQSTITQYQNDRGPQYAIVQDDSLAGVIGYLPFDRNNRIAEIGYWISEDQQGHGTVTACCKVLVESAFSQFEMNKVQIRAAEGNGKSRAIPERLGFTFEGILREREFLYDHYVNHAVYSLLKSEYPEWASRNSLEDHG